MSELYVASYIDDVDGLMWGIFYDENGERHHHCEKWTPKTGWIPLKYRYEEDANRKFESIINEYKREVMAIPFSMLGI